MPGKGLFVFIQKENYLFHDFFTVPNPKGEDAVEKWQCYIAEYSNDYEIVVEHKYYAVFRDGECTERKIEIEKEVAGALTKAQRAENNQSRYARKYTVSLDSLDYEGEAFASYDDYQTDKEPPLDEKVKTVLKQMKPKQARLLYEIVFMHKTQEEIAAREKVSQAAVSQRFAVCKTNFKKTFEKLFPKTLYSAPF